MRIAAPDTTSQDVSTETPDTNTNGGSGTTGENTTITPIAAQTEAPAVNVEAVAETVREILQSISGTISTLITDDTKVMEFPSNAANPNSARSVEDLSAEELSIIPEDQTPAVILPVMIVEEPAVYVFGVTLDNLEVGALIFLHLMAEPVNGGAFHDAAEDEDAYTFLDDDGKETKTVPENKHVNVAAYMTPENTYAPIITTEAPEEADTANDGDKTNIDATGPGEAGGCDTGIAMLWLAVLAVIIPALNRRNV